MPDKENQTKKLTLTIPETTHKQIRLLCALAEETQSDLIARLVRVEFQARRGELKL